MSLNAGSCRTWSHGRKTIAFGTKIDIFVPPHQGLRTKMTAFSVTVGGTAHTLTALRPLGRTTISAAAAAGATTLILARDPGAYAANALADKLAWVPSVADNLIASGDYIACKKPDGTYYLVAVGTCTTNADGTVSCASVTVPTGGLAAGAPVYFFGVAADTDPNTNEAHPAFTLAASGTTSSEVAQGSLAETIRTDEPMLLQENNATATAVVELLSGVYGP